MSVMTLDATGSFSSHVILARKNYGDDRESLLLKYLGFGLIKTLPKGSLSAVKRYDK
jgi:hypothetical protein